jgi:hypothetical protein
MLLSSENQSEHEKCLISGAELSPLHAWQANAAKPGRAATTLTRAGSAAAHDTSGGRFGRSEQTSLRGAHTKVGEKNETS